MHKYRLLKIYPPYNIFEGEKFLADTFFSSYFWLSMYLYVRSILADEKMDGLKFLMRTDVGINKVVDRL